jgi:hypothetical protein
MQSVRDLNKLDDSRALSIRLTNSGAVCSKAANKPAETKLGGNQP